MLSKLDVNHGVAGFLLANGALNIGDAEGTLRKEILERDRVEAIIVLPRDMFYGDGYLEIFLYLILKKRFFSADYVEKYFSEEIEPHKYKQALSVIDSIFSTNPKEFVTVAEKMIAFAELIYPTKRNKTAIANLQTVLSSEEMLSNYFPAAKDEINIMTLHKSKGLEFNIVFHMDMYKWVLSNEYGNEEEKLQNLNLHYVGVTRAIDVCYIMLGSKIYNSKGKCYDALPSSFLEKQELTYRRVDAIKSVIETVWHAIHTVISTVLNVIWSVISSVWNKVFDCISSVLNTIKSVVTTIWNAVSSIISSVLNAISSVVSSVWNSMKNTISSVMNTIKETVSNIWNNVKSAVSEKITAIKDTVVNGFNAAVSFVKGLASEAWNWGADIINGIVDGIKSCIGKVGDAVSGVADKIKSYLHFSVPDEGPLTDFESWMPDFMKGLAKGINQSKKYVETAVSGVAEAMRITMKSDLNMKFDGISGAMMNGGESTTVINNVHNDNSRTVNQTNNSPKSLSRLEIYRMTRNALKV